MVVINPLSQAEYDASLAADHEVVKYSRVECFASVCLHDRDGSLFRECPPVRSAMDERIGKRQRWPQCGRFRVSILSTARQDTPNRPNTRDGTEQCLAPYE